MGYYTNYSIRVVPKERGYHFSDGYFNLLDNEDFEDMSYQMGEALHEINPNYFSNGYCLQDQIDNEAMRWYDYAEDMTTLSKKFPEYLFVLSGDGEDQGDIWFAYFLNGKSQLAMAEITFEDCTLC